MEWGKNHLTFKSFSTNVQLAWAKRAGLSSFGCLFVAAAAAVLDPNVGGLPSIGISFTRHFDVPFLTRLRLLPLLITFD